MLSTLINLFDRSFVTLFRELCTYPPEASTPQCSKKLYPTLNPKELRKWNELFNTMPAEGVISNLPVLEDIFFV